MEKDVKEEEETRGSPWIFFVPKLDWGLLHCHEVWGGRREGEEQHLLWDHWSSGLAPSPARPGAAAR